MDDDIFTHRPGTPILDFHCHGFGYAYVYTDAETWREWEEQGFFEAITFPEHDPLMIDTCPLHGCRGAYDLKKTWEELYPISA